LYGELCTNDRLLFLAGPQIPKEWAAGPVTLQQATTITLLTSSAPNGGEALLGFTSHEEVMRRNPSLGSFAMHSRAVLELVITAGLDALVLNPGGPWAAVPRNDIQTILREEIYAP
jgi:hypothetical protein